jgi:hypothetical protein
MDDVEASGPAETQFAWEGAALAVGSLIVFAAAAELDPADVVAEHPVPRSASNTMLAAAACLCLTGSLHDTTDTLSGLTPIDRAVVPEVASLAPPRSGDL